MKGYVKNQIKSRAFLNRKQKQTNRKLHKESKKYLNDIIDKIARNGAKEAIESALLVERDEFLGRKPHQRVPDKDFRGYRNGYSLRTIVDWSAAKLKSKCPESLIAKNHSNQKSYHHIFEQPQQYLIPYRNFIFMVYLAVTFGRRWRSY